MHVEQRLQPATPPARQDAAFGMDLVGLGLAGLGLSMAGLSLVMIVAPGFFFEQISPFGIRNDHFIIDGATFQLALGIGAVVAARVASWRIPVLAILVFQYAIHSVNHLVDIGDTDPAWNGVMNFVFLALGTFLLAYLLIRERREGEVR